MKQEISDNELEMVTGGTVIVSDLGKVGFTTIGKKFKLQNCTWKEARNLAEDMLDENPNMSNEDFDQLVLNRFIELGWINP